MDDPHEEQKGALARLASDPLRARKVGAIALLVCAPLAGIGHAASGFASAMLAAVCWALALPIALGIGHGDAFFLQYGRARRRVLLTLLAGAVLALGACVALSGISNAGDRGALAEGVGYAVLYFALTLALASLLAILLGYGKDYVSERIMRMSREDW